MLDLELTQRFMLNNETIRKDKILGEQNDIFR